MMFRNVRRKVAALVATAAASALLLAGCSGSGGSSGQESLTFWTFSDWTTGAVGDSMKSLVSGFEKKNPNITVKVVGKTSTDIVTGIAANGTSGSVDVVTTQFGPGSPLIGAGALKDLTSDWKAAGSSYRGEFDTQFTDSMERGGGRWGVPFTLTSTVMYRNLNVLAKAGIDTKTPPATWDELLAQMPEIKAAGDYAVADQTSFWMPMENWYSGATGSPEQFKLTKDSRSSNLNQGAMTSAMEFIKKTMPYSAPVNAIDQGETDLFTSNKLAYVVAGAWLYPTFKAAESHGLKWDSVAVPGQTAGKTGGVYDGEFFGIPVGSKHADAAWKFIQYMTEAKQQAAFGAAAARVVSNTAALSEPGLKNNAFIQQQAATIKDSMNDAPFLAPVPADAPNAFADGAAKLKAGSPPSDVATDIIKQYNASLANSN
jgi:multiple sugar transport system substrate-binding protein